MSDVESRISDVGRRTAHISFRIRDTTVPKKYTLPPVCLFGVHIRLIWLFLNTDRKILNSKRIISKKWRNSNTDFAKYKLKTKPPTLLIIKCLLNHWFITNGILYNTIRKHRQLKKEVFPSRRTFLYTWGGLVQRAIFKINLFSAWMGETNRENVSDEARGQREMSGSPKKRNKQKNQTYWKMQPSIIIFPRRGSIGSLARR